MTPNKQEWQLITDALKKAVGVENYTAWLATMQPIEDTREGVVLLAIPTKFIVDYVQEHWHQIILEECQNVLSGKLVVEYTVQAITQPVEENKTFRDVPEADNQPDMFVPNITEIAIKDDVHLMEIAPFTLQPRGETRNELIYDDVNGVNIRIEANPKYGLISALDYDLVLMMQSWLADMANEYRKKLAIYKQSGKGKAPPKPPRYFEPHIKEILLFARNYKKSGANQKERVEGMLERLKGTEVRISKAGRKRRRWGSFSLIHDWEILMESGSGNILQVKIEIPSWIYEGIVEAPIPTILTYEPDYFLLKQPMLRFMYRFCRLQDNALKTASHMDFPLTEIYKRSGSRRPLKRFNMELREIVNNLPTGLFFRWQVSIEGQRSEGVLRLQRKAELLEHQ